MNLRERIRAWRKSAGLTQYEVAERIGIRSAAVGQWEQAGGTEPTHENLAAFCSAAGISLAQFWGPLPPARPRRSRKAA